LRAPLTTHNLLTGAPHGSVEHMFMVHLLFILGTRPRNTQPDAKVLLYTYLTSLQTRAKALAVRLGLGLGNGNGNGNGNGPGGPGGSGESGSGLGPGLDLTLLGTLGQDLRAACFSFSTQWLDYLASLFLTLYFTVMPLYTVMMYSWYAVAPMLLAVVIILVPFVVSRILRVPFSVMSLQEATRDESVAADADDGVGDADPALSRAARELRRAIKDVSLELRALRTIAHWVVSHVSCLDNNFQWWGAVGDD
jgi:hypothetical protein